MQVLITYDVATESPGGSKRLRRVAQVCKSYGQRVQKSVFECTVTLVQYEELVRCLLSYIDEAQDNLRVYRLREPKERFVKEYGTAQSIDFEGPLIM